MIFKEFGDRALPTVILLHGGGLSDWSWKKVVDELQPTFHMVTPVIDGHGEDGKTEFISIENASDKLMRYIDQNCGGKVFAIGGLSIGAQIVVELLSKRSDIAQYAIIESALVYPMKDIGALAVPSYRLLYGLIKRRWFSKIQAKALSIPKELFEAYYSDSLKMTKQSLINMSLSNGNYVLKDAIANTSTRALIIVGAKELGIMKKSANLLYSKIKDSRLLVAQGMKHGELSMLHTDKYIAQIKALFSFPSGY
jgi:pimeloyl-ACP methyl ester carboxylesterase